MGGPPGSPTAILAVRRFDVRALNEMVREHRKASGELGEDIRIGEKTFSVGDGSSSSRTSG